jgi:catechol 2,3-dioxygenase-like lactoylglutathione lyase family enzyme
VPEPDLDHTSFAVHDAMAWARRLRRELGATPIAGEALPEFRYLLLHVGTARAGGRLELIEPAGEGFATRYLRRHGEGPHHLTFTVPDLRATVAQVRALGATVVGEDYDHPSWQEVFIAPDAVHGVVIQLAHSDSSFPPPADLMSSTRRDTERFPSSRGATDPTWWTGVWDTPAERTAVLGATHLASTDLAFSRRLFADVLGAQARTRDGTIDLHWPGGGIRVVAGATPGVTGVAVSGGPPGGVMIGPTTLGPDPDRGTA